METCTERVVCGRHESLVDFELEESESFPPTRDIIPSSRTFMMIQDDMQDLHKKANKLLGPNTSQLHTHTAQNEYLVVFSILRSSFF